MRIRGMLVDNEDGLDRRCRSLEKAYQIVNVVLVICQHPFVKLKELAKALMPKAETYLPLRITLVNPPKGVMFAVQRGKAELETPSMASGENLSFNVAVRVGNRKDERPNFLGPFVQGPRGARFVYVNSGTSAGQLDSCWTRRAKIGLKEIGWDLVDRVLAKSSSLLEAKIAGKAGDGGPACATVRLLGDGWTIDEQGLP